MTDYKIPDLTVRDLVIIIDEAIPEGIPLDCVGGALIAWLILQAKQEHIDKTELKENIVRILDQYWELIPIKPEEKNEK